jgi:eukaryotic-like serine/threonine-protein kinase
LDVKAVNCETGDSLAEEQETADGKEKVLAALSQAATKLRGRLGESLKSIEKFDARLEQATTSSLPALQSYSLGRKTFTGGDMAFAVSPLQRAIQLDPSFAQAYAALGVTYMNRGEFGLAEDNMRKAYQLRERVSEQERFFIDLHYYEDAAGDLEKARQVGELWAQTYPRSSLPFGNLGGTYLVLGRHDKALVAFHEALRLDPDVPTRQLRLANAYMRLNRFQEALALAKQLQSKKSDTGDLHFFLYQIALCENDAAGVAREVAWSVGKPVYEHLFLNFEASRLAHYGKIRKARELVDRATNLAEREQQKQTAANYQGWQALAEAFFGNGAEAQKRATAALKLSSTKEVIILAAIAGERARTEQLIADLNKRYPDHTFLQNTWLPLASAQFALQRDDPQTAIEVLQRAQPYELGLGDNLLSSFVRGKAYLAMHGTTDAIAEFQKILDHRGIVLLAPLGALAHLGLARAYALQGDTAKAKAAYDDFLVLWKDADPDVPVLIQARSEYAKLR